MTDLLTKTHDILASLVAFPTVSSQSNLQLIDYVANRLDDCGAAISIVHNDDKSKANIFATLGPERDGGIVLSGHSDVVPVDGQNWSSNPFALLQRDNLLYGRGCCDMKGFLAAVLAVAPQYSQLSLTRPIHIAFTYDEEVGCFGAKKLVTEIANWDFTPNAAIIGEPSGMRIIEGHKSCCDYTTEFHGLAAHGALPDEGVNAIEYAARYIDKMMQLRDKLPSMAPANSRFHPPWTTVQVGRISGGKAHNIIPWYCQVDWQMRTVQPADGEYMRTHLHEYCRDTLLPSMQKTAAQADIVTSEVSVVEGFQPASENEAKQIVAELTGDTESAVVSFATEAGLFQSLGMNVVICGPGFIEQAHKPDEFISNRQLQQCLDMLQSLQQKVA